MAAATRVEETLKRHATTSPLAAVPALGLDLDALRSSVEALNVELAAALVGFNQSLREADAISSWLDLESWFDRLMGLLRYAARGLHEQAVRAELATLQTLLDQMIGARAAPAGSPARRVLVIDDSRIVRAMLAQNLMAVGHDVMAVACLAEVESAITTFSPHVIVSDILLPDGTGDELCAHLKETQQRFLPVILMSDLPDVELAERAANAKADGFVSKRYGAAKVVTVLESLLSEIVF